MPDWRVCKRDGAWRVYDRGVWHETHRTLPEAHTAATQLAVACDLFTEGGLSCLKKLREREREWVLANFGNQYESLAQWEEELVYVFHQATVQKTD
jgi:hypothetical protein